MHNILLHRCPVIYLVSPVTKHLFSNFYHCEQYCNKQYISVDFFHILYFYYNFKWPKMILCDHLGSYGWFWADSGDFFFQGQMANTLGTEGHVQSLLFILLFLQTFKTVKYHSLAHGPYKNNPRTGRGLQASSLTQFRSCFIKRPMKTESYLRILGGCASHHILLDSVA